MIETSITSLQEEVRQLRAEVMELKVEVNRIYTTVALIRWLTPTILAAIGVLVVVMRV